MHPWHLHVNSQVELQHVALEWGSLHHIYHKCQYLSFVRAALPLVVLHKPVKTIIPTVLKFRVSVCSDPPPVPPPHPPNFSALIHTDAGNCLRVHVVCVLCLALLLNRGRNHRTIKLSYLRTVT